MAAAGADALSPGTVIESKYRIDRVVGRGGFAVVYAAEHLALSAQVAVKVLSQDALRDTERREQLLSSFTSEARLLTKLRHTCIVRTLDQGILWASDGAPTPYLVLEWCGEQSLKSHLLAHGAMPVAQALAILRGVTEGVAHAHDVGVAHRDLKPSNVMVSPGPDGALAPRVIDFGIAKLFHAGEAGGSGHTATRSGAFGFTPAYAAPEQVAGARTGPWTDVHAIGLLFVEMVTGHAPYAKPLGSGLAAIDEARPTPAALGVDVGPLEPVIARALSLRPRDRFQHAGELAAAIHQAACAMGFASQSSAPRASSVRAERGQLPSLTELDRVTAKARHRKRRGLLMAGVGLGVGAIAATVTSLSGLLGKPSSTTHTAPSENREEPPPPGAEASASSPPTVPPRRRHLGSLSLDELGKRAQLAGLNVRGTQQRSMHPVDLMVTYEHGAKIAYAYLIEVPVPHGSSPADHPLLVLPTVRSWIELDRRQSQGLVYGIAGAFVLSISGFDADVTTKAFTKLAEGFELDVLGNSFTGPDPASRAADTRPLWRARSLASLGAAELALRLHFAGAEPVAVAGAPGLQFTLTRGPHKGEVRLFSDPAKALGLSAQGEAGQAHLRALRARKQRFAFATEDEWLIACSGGGELAERSFLVKVLDGLKIEARQGE